ncbi:MAG: 3-deoxy-D-manno-octulosonic acid transferase [bacterium]|nr:3-deoxy-D-manno-octulosonic acid transferase [bacterium]
MLLPFYLVKAKRTGVDIRYWFGFIPPELHTGSNVRKTIWIHAVSVGEVNAVKPLIKKIRESNPSLRIILSTVTGTGQTVARQSVPEVDQFIFFPSDLIWNLRRLFKYINPQLLILVETELWPNLISLCASRSIPIMLINGRISPRSFMRYKKVRWFFQPLLNKMTLFLMQSETEVDRIRTIGAPHHKIKITGNIKFDISIPELTDLEKQRYRAMFGFEPSQPVWLVGSTHPGEEKLILQVYKAIRATQPELRLILVPRHPHRAEEVGKEIELLGLPYVRRSQLPPECATDRVNKAFTKALSPILSNPDSPVRVKNSHSIILVDTVGELTKLYALADVVFIGGSLVPIGGHNVLEPATLGKPILFGPYMHNFEFCAELLLSAGGGIQVNNIQDLESQLSALLEQPELRRQLGEKARSAVIANQGATERTFEEIKKYLN